MRTAEGYRTRQRELIGEILRENSNGHLTVDEIVELLGARNAAVGRTTVYRCLERLTAEGKLRKYSAAGESACYQYIDGEECHEHFHLKCKCCGRLIHMECEHMHALSGHILNEHGFAVDPLCTVLYGICADCAEKENGNR